MSDIRIEALPGEYSNDDAYEKVLGYISNKSYIGGFDLPVIRISLLSNNFS